MRYKSAYFVLIYFCLASCEPPIGPMPSAQDYVDQGKCVAQQINKILSSSNDPTSENSVLIADIVSARCTQTIKLKLANAGNEGHQFYYQNDRDTYEQILSAVNDAKLKYALNVDRR